MEECPGKKPFSRSWTSREKTQRGSALKKSRKGLCRAWQGVKNLWRDEPLNGMEKGLEIDQGRKWSREAVRKFELIGLDPSTTSLDCNPEKRGGLDSSTSHWKRL